MSALEEPVTEVPEPVQTRTVLAGDDFRHGTANWVVELERGGSVSAWDGALDVEVPGGATAWWRHELTGSHEVRLTVTAISAGGPHDRVSDLNVFWAARDPRSPRDLFAHSRTGAFADYDLLTTYYVGFGGNSNTTTRFRRYVGEAGNRPILGDLTAPLLVANREYRLRLVADGSTIRYWLDGDLLFTYDDPEPYRGGWFGLRTTASHLRATDFTILGPVRP